MVMSVCAPDTSKSMEMYEECIASVVKNIREGRKGGARNFYIAGDIGVELGLMCTNENEQEELTKLCGPLRLQGYDKDLAGFKKKYVYGIMKEFDCKVSSTWSACGKVRVEASKHRRLDYVIGPMRKNDEVYIHNAGRLWATWDHYPIFARIEEEPHVKVFQKRKKWTGWKPKTEEQSILFSRDVMKKGGDKEEHLSTVQKNRKSAAKKIQHRTNAQKEKEMMRTPENVSRSGRKLYGKNQEESTQETGQESQS